MAKHEAVQGVYSVASAQGEDRSSYQSVAPWTGLAFGAAKATEGTGWKDPTFAANWANMARDGLAFRAAYHFFHPSSDPLAQAKFFYDTVKAQGLEPGDGLVADIEITVGLGLQWVLTNHAAARSHLLDSGDNQVLSVRAGAAVLPVEPPLSFGSVDSASKEFLDELARLAGPKVPVIVYTTLSVGATLGSCTGYPLWIAWPNTSAPVNVHPWPGWTLWQWSFGGGQNGGDRDSFNGTREQLDAWVAKYKPAPAPAPKPTPAPAPAPKPQPKPAPVPVTLLEDPVLLNKGAGAKTPVALPNGATHVRFFADQGAELKVDLRDGNAAADVKLEYNSAHSLAVPKGIHGIVVTRVDNGDNDVSAAVWA